MFVEATVSAESCERGCSDRPPIGRIDLLIAEDEIGPTSLNLPTEQRNPPIKCKCTNQYL